MSNNTSGRRASSNALAKIEDSFHRFKDTVSPSDARQFQNTELEHVWDAAKVVEKRLGDKGEYRALRRVQPFLTALGNYSEVVGVLCNGTPYLPWIWAPIKLFLQIASEYLSAFDKLIKAYAEIADALPRFDRLSNALKHRQDFQLVLAVFYCDILEFHRRAYKFFRTSGWKRFFSSSWGRFDIRFKGVIEDLKYHAELVDKEANAYDIATAEDWRQTQLEELGRREKQRTDDQFQTVLNWLDNKDYLLEDHIDNLVDQCCEGTSDWFFDHAKIKSWLAPAGQPVLWLNGKPGSGKSVLSARLIRHVQAKKSHLVVYFVCNFRSMDSNTCSYILRAFVRQLVKQQQHFAAVVYDEYVTQGIEPTKERLKQLVPTLLDGSNATRVIVDGIDECTINEQSDLLSALRTFVEKITDTTDFKFAVFSRDTYNIQKRLYKYPTVSLKNEKLAIEQSIKSFVSLELAAICSGLEDGFANRDVFATVESRIVDKADGMFLWVRLILETLQDLNSEMELEKAVEDLPSGLDEAYGRILQLIREDEPRGSLHKVMTAFSLIAFAERPLKDYEILDGITLCTAPYQLQDKTKLSPRELNRCKPLIEIDASHNVSFAHFTVQEYILDITSGPFLPAVRALNMVTLACVRYLISSLDFVDPNINEQRRILSIASGFHGLHRYATTYWLLHLQKLSKSCDSSVVLPEPNLTTHLTELCERRRRLIGDNTQLDDDCPASCQDNHRLNAFQQIEQLNQFVHQVWHHQQDDHRDIEKNETAKPNLTVLTEVSNYYNLVIEKLLADDSAVTFSFIPQDTIRRFKELYGNTGFPCRFPKCRLHSQGFSSEADRDKHERDHQPRIFCPDSSCQYSNTIGFRTATALRRHVREIHERNRVAVPEFRPPRATQRKTLQVDVPRTSANAKAPSAPDMPKSFEWKSPPVLREPEQLSAGAISGLRTGNDDSIATTRPSDRSPYIRPEPQDFSFDPELYQRDADSAYNVSANDFTNLTNVDSFWGEPLYSPLMSTSAFPEFPSSSPKINDDGIADFFTNPVSWSELPGLDMNQFVQEDGENEANSRDLQPDQKDVNPLDVEHRVGSPISRQLRENKAMMVQIQAEKQRDGQNKLATQSFTKNGTGGPALAPDQGQSDGSDLSQQFAAIADALNRTDSSYLPR